MSEEEQKEIIEKKEEKPLIINGRKIEFKESFKAREWLSVQKAKFREGVESQLNACIRYLKTSFTRDELLDLETKDFLAIWYAFQKKIGNLNDSDFL